jgi:hypothetical protein
MNYRLEKLISKQVEMVEILQDRADEVLDWRTTPENAETVVAYFEALEYAVEGLERLSKFYQDNKEWKLAEDDDDRKSDRNVNHKDEFRISDRTREDRDDYDNRRR